MSGVRSGGVGDSLEALLADAVAAEAARQRSADRMLRQAAAEEATFAGLLLDLAERCEPVMVGTAAGRVRHGVVRAVGRDFAVVHDRGRADAPPVFVRLAAVTSVRPGNGSAAVTEPTGGRRPPLDASLAAVLGGLTASRPRVQVGVAGDQTLLTGELASVGADVLTLRRPAVVLPIAAVTEVVLLDC